MTDLAIKGASANLLRFIDWAEKTVLFVLFLGLLYRVGGTLQQQPFNILLLISDGFVVMLMLLRRRTDAVSQKPMDWLLAAMATAAPMMVSGGGVALIPQVTGALIMAGGLIFSLYAKVVLWRSFGLVPANRGVKSSGPYRLVRHPMYLGYMITQVGFLLLNPVWTNLALYGSAFALQIMRLKAEESLLAQDPSYAAYMTATRYRLLPGLF